MATATRTAAGNNALARALDPNSIAIDGRDLRDQLAFAARVADLIYFYNAENRRAGSWQPFLLKEPLILLALISKTEYLPIHAEAARLKMQTRAPSADVTQLPMNNSFALIARLFKTLNLWLQQFGNARRTAALREFLCQKIRQSLASDLWLMIAIQQYLHDATQGLVEAPDLATYRQFETIWQHTQTTAGVTATFATLLNTAPTAELTARGTAELWHIYQRVFSVFVQIVDSARSAFDRLQQNLQSGTESADYYPDTALLIAFAQMMQTQQAAINAYSARHLDFFYQRILRMQAQGARADQVHVFVRLAEGVSDFTVPANTAFIGADSAGQPITFASTQATTLNQASIACAYTTQYCPPDAKSSSAPSGVFVNTIAQPNVIRRDTHNQQIGWPAFGATNGSATQIGFALASPLLALAAGTRTINIKLQFAQPVAANFLADSTFSLSTAQSWLAVTATQIEIPQDATKATDTLHYQITLDEHAPAIAAFESAPAGLASEWPLLKVTLGSRADLSRPPALACIDLTTDISGSDQLVLATDTATLQNHKPSALFGGLPVQGNAFYAGSAECFAKPLTALSLTQTWDTLPPQFGDYYQAYNLFLSGGKDASSPFCNDAFKGSWHQLDRRQWQPLAAKKTPQPKSDDEKKKSDAAPHGEATRIEHDSNVDDLIRDLDHEATKPPTKKHTESNVATLFQTDAHGANAATTQLTFTLPSNWQAEPDLLKAPLPAIAVATSGYLRLLLNAPQYAFGHSLYAAVVANVSLENAQTLIAQASSSKPTGKAAGNNKNTPANNTAQDATKTLLQAAGSAGKLTALAASARVSIATAVLKFVIDKIKQRFSRKKNGSTNATTNTSTTPTLQPMPNPPFLPRLTSVTLHYSASHSHTLSQSVASTYPLQIFHCGALASYRVYDAQNPGASLGWCNLTPASNTFATTSLPLFAPVSTAGCLYLGLNNTVGADTLLLFADIQQHALNSAFATGEIKVYGWTSSGWQALSVLKDGTEGFNCSGVIEFALPATLASSPLLPGNQNWIAIAPDASAVSAARTLHISFLDTQVITLARVLNNATNTCALATIPAASISATQAKIPQIASITQPLASFGGAAAETSDDFRSRTAQRLHSKDRCHAPGDYAAMTLRACPTLHFVKTLRASEMSAPTPGTLGVGLVNGYASAEHPNAFRPCLDAGQRIDIENYLRRRAAQTATIRVFNLRHQSIAIAATLQVGSGAQLNTLRTQLQQAMRIYLAPWISSDQPQYTLADGLKRSALIAFLRGFDAVTGIGKLTITLGAIDKTPAKTTSDEIIRPGAHDAILVPAEPHDIDITLTVINSLEQAYVA